MRSKERWHTGRLLGRGLEGERVRTPNSRQRYRDCPTQLIKHIVWALSDSNNSTLWSPIWFVPTLYIGKFRQLGVTRVIIHCGESLHGIGTVSIYIDSLCIESDSKWRVTRIIRDKMPGRQRSSLWEHFVQPGGNFYWIVQSQVFILISNWDLFYIQSFCTEFYK